MTSTDAIFLAGACVLAVLLTTGVVVSHRKHLAQVLKRHLGAHPSKLVLVSRSFPVLDFPNVEIAITQLTEATGRPMRVVGYNGSSIRDVMHEPRDFLAAGRAAVGPVRYRDVDVDVDRRMQCRENPVYLVETDKGKLAAHIWFDWHSRHLELEVMGQNREAAAAFIEEVRTRATQSSIYRGKIISIATRTGQQDWHPQSLLTVQFHRFPSVRREEIILPPATMSVIERNVVSFFRHADALRQSGRSVKRGILFHGKPGTGKTYTAKCLAQSLDGVTVILLSGEQLLLLKECCQMARMLAPSLVIMEDVDLVGTARNQSTHQTALHELLNEMDGLSPDAQVIFLLTTNRPEVLEPALADRPGRIDQTIHFPLPDAECRRRLLELYGHGLVLDMTNPDRMITKTEGASPAFIQELVRKAALIAAEGNSWQNGSLRLVDQHLDDAMQELLLGGETTKNLLGFR